MTPSSAEQSESHNEATQPEAQPVEVAAVAPPAHPDSEGIEQESTNVAASEIVEENVSVTNQEKSVEAEITISDESSGKLDEARDLDPGAVESGAAKVETNDTESNSKLNKDEGNRTFTMRELLNELKNGGVNEDAESDNREAGIPNRSVNEIFNFSFLLKNKIQIDFKIEELMVNFQLQH